MYKIFLLWAYGGNMVKRGHQVSPVGYLYQRAHTRGLIKKELRLCTCTVISSDGKYVGLISVDIVRCFNHVFTVRLQPSFLNKMYGYI
jgi:hypothetical protein